MTEKKVVTKTEAKELQKKELKEVAKSLKSNIRKSDVLCRYGGEEFVILFPHILASAVPHMAEKLRKGVEEARPKGIFRLHQYRG